MSKFDNPEREVFDKKTEEFFKKKLDKNKTKPLTEGQKYYLETIEHCQFIICDGPAGTGKTHIALSKGLEYLKANKYKQLLVIRPLQECGRPIGFLPGEKEDKLGPHMAAFYQLFSKLIGERELADLVKENKIVIDTCEFMRGVTFDEMFVVIDEAQNCTMTQIKMLLSRMGKDSKMVITGDGEQTDLWRKEDLIGSRSAFSVTADRLFNEDKDIGVVELDESDIVRNGLIGKILKLLDGK